MTALGDLHRVAERPVRADRPATPPAPIAAADGPRRDAPAPGEARLSAAFADFVDSGWSLPRFVLQRPAATLRAVADVRALPRLDARLPRVPEAEAVRDQLMSHPRSRRAMGGVSAVLAVPADREEYLEGRSRATVRRKTRAAERRGITVRPVPPADRAALRVLADRHERENEREEYRVDCPDNADLLDLDLWLAAFDGEGRALALAVIPVAGEWAALRYLRTLTGGPDASDARYLLVVALAGALAERGARYLVDTARPHWLPNGLRHFQRMVGFRLVRVSPVRIG